MRTKIVLIIFTALAILVLALGSVLALSQTSADEPESVDGIGPVDPTPSKAGGQPTETAPSTMPKMASTTTSIVDELAGDEELDLDLSKVDVEDPEAVASGFGCAYWAQPIRGETAAELSLRIKPLATRTLVEAVAKLRNSTDNSGSTATVSVGALEKLSEGKYRVFCNRIVLGADGLPKGPPSAVQTEMELVETAGGWAVETVVVGALSLP